MAAQAMPKPDERPHGYILGFDFGKRRIGVAVGQSLTATATPLAIVSNGEQPDWTEISRFVKDWKPGGFVVGLPLSIDAEETEMSALARSFGQNLSARYGKEVHYQDERLTSVEAQSDFADMRAAGGARRKDASKLDAVAAKIILENWLQNE
jgi:putative Holliday junction resolvase